VSLIDEALKRAQAAGQGEQGRPADRPWIPSPMPDAGLATRRRLLRVAGACGAAAVLIAAALFFWQSRPPSAPEKQPERPHEAPAASVAVEPVAPVTLAAAPAAAPRVRATDPPAAAAQEPVETPSAPTRAAQSIVEGRSFVGSIALPDGAKVELGGIVWSEAEPRALVNDRIVAVGAYVAGFTVVRIEEDRLALEKDGVTVFLTVK
jgi:hypothetical protein